MRSIAKYRPAAPIIAVTHDRKTSHKLSLVWGVQQIVELPKIKNIERLIDKFKDVALRQKILSPGDKIIVTMGSIVGKEGTTNMIRIIEL